MLVVAWQHHQLVSECFIFAKCLISTVDFLAKLSGRAFLYCVWIARKLLPCPANVGTICFKASMSSSICGTSIITLGHYFTTALFRCWNGGDIFDAPSQQQAMARSDSALTVDKLSSKVSIQQYSFCSDMDLLIR
eukprot:6214099-Pleurochrysis_carterae.AAC.4